MNFVPSYVATTRVCTTAGIIGVPVGAQTEGLALMRTGTPFTNTRVAGVVNWPVMHGPFAAGGGGKGHPAMRYGVPATTTGWPLTSTRGTLTAGVAWPACEHMTVAPRWRMRPGMIVGQMMVSAP